MSVSGIDFLLKLENPSFGEIENYCIDEYEKSFEDYYEYLIMRNQLSFLEDFGIFKFAEIDNILLEDFGKTMIGLVE